MLPSRTVARMAARCAPVRVQNSEGYEDEEDEEDDDADDDAAAADAAAEANEEWNADEGVNATDGVARQAAGGCGSCGYTSPSSSVYDCASRMPLPLVLSN